MSFETNRRQFLRGAIAASALLAARSRVLSLNYERHFAPVKVSRDRVIREVVGLRPYRAEGFVVDTRATWEQTDRTQLWSRRRRHDALMGHGLARGGSLARLPGSADVLVRIEREARTFASPLRCSRLWRQRSLDGAHVAAPISKRPRHRDHLCA